MLISLIQPNFQQGPKEFNAHYLPYSVGVLWSYSNQFKKVSDNYTLDQIVWRRADIEQTAESIKNNDVLVFSTYVWNRAYNYALAARVKELNPGCVTIFGGPEIPITKKNIFKKNPFMDVVVKGEGEISLKNILECLVDGDRSSLSNTAGLLLNTVAGLVDTGDSERIDILDDIPSPYLTGVFDKIIAETTGIEWNATLETNRGCPYQCTFCDWGSLTYNKVKQFNLDRVFDELDWIARNKCGFVTITDANFGMFIKRDDAIANKLLALQEEFGYPASLSITWAKNQKPEVFAIVSKLIKSPRFNSGLTVSVQSMDEDVLEHIKRKNLDQHKISEIFALCEKHDVPVYTEVILALPGESAETWKEGIWKLFRAGNHTGLNFLHAQLLENAEMNLLQRKLFKIDSIYVYDYFSGAYDNTGLREGVEIVTSTKSMPFNRVVDSQVFNWYINAFHVNGLTTFISRFINKEFGIDYSIFYDKLFAHLEKDPWFRDEVLRIRELYIKWMTEGKIDHPDIGNIEIHGWNLSHLATINIHAHNQYDHVFNMIREFVTAEFNFDQKLISQLIEFQQLYVINYNDISTYPRQLTTDYDFQGYLQNDSELNTVTKYEFTFFEEANISRDRFLESVYFGRKRNFGKAIITKCL